MDAPGVGIPRNIYWRAWSRYTAMAELSKDDDYDPFTDEGKTDQLVSSWGTDRSFPPPDMERVLREEKSFSAEDGWIFLKKDDLNEVWRKKDPNKPDNLIKVRD